MSVRLDKLRIEEVSGVDQPANDLPGFMVYKARTGAFTALAKAINETPLAKALEADDYDGVIAAMKASPQQPRNAAGQFRPTIPGIDSRPTPPSGATTPAGDVQPEDPSSTEKQTSFFKPARGVYRRIF
jgi:hypothetical protein